MAMSASLWILAFACFSPVLCETLPKVEAFFQGHCNELSPCHQRCLDLPHGGFECACWQGFKLHSNGFSCIEIGSEGTTPPVNGSEELFDASTTSQPKKVTPEDTGPKNGVKSLETKIGLESLIPPDDLDLYKLEEPSWDDFLLTKDEDARRKKDTKQDMKDDPLDMMMGDEPAMDASQYNAHLYNHGYDPRDDFLADWDRRGQGRDREANRVNGRRRKNRLRNKHDEEDKQLADALPPNPTEGMPQYPYGTGDMNEEMSNKVVSETSRPPIKFQSCAELRCHAGGRCVADTLRGGVRCQCRLGNTGDFCEQDVVVQFPKFMGTGYMAFPVLRGAYKEFTINMEFRPDTGNGLLLFSASDPSALADFFSLTLIDGYAELRFDCGTGMSQITTINQVQLGQWNKVTVHRNDNNGWIQLNDGPQAKGRARGLYTRITFREDLYLGGYRNTSSIGLRTGMNWGFVGCVRHLEINGKNYDMRKGAFVGDAIHGIDVSECSADVCEGVKCHNGGTCIADSPDSHVCLCPLGTAGDRCENRIDIHVPEFSGMSYLQYIGLRRTVLSFTEIEVVFKAYNGNGMILYNGYTTDRSGDYIYLGLRDSFLEYSFDLGTGAAHMRSRTPITLNEWHVVRISRTGRDGYMQIDNQAAVEGMSKGAYTQLTLTLDLFIGGHRNFDEVAKNAHATTSFKGCIQKVVINERPLKLLEEAINGVNVDNCNHPCVGQPCLNGGRCIPIRDFYKCSCPLGFENTNCEDKLDTDPIKVPMFSGDSYLMYTDPFLLQRIRGKKIDIQMRVRAQEPDGLLFWTGEEVMTSSSDYLAIGLKDGHAQFGFNLGSGEVLITYNESRIDDGNWHKIRVQRYEKVGYLEIDGTELIEGTSPGNLKQLNTRSIFYIGGMEDIVHSTLKKYTSGLVGCISNVTLATNFHIDLIVQASDGQNIKACS